MSLSPTNKRVQQMQKVQAEGLELFKKKNADYGDSFATYGPIGVIVRVGDKINRLSSVTQNGVNLVDTESTRDTLIDLHNYTAMAIMLLDEKKKILHRRINEIKKAAPINEDVTPVISRPGQLPFTRGQRWASAYLNKQDKMAAWARRSKSSESRK